MAERKRKRGRNWYALVKSDPEKMLDEALPTRIRWQPWVYQFDGQSYRMVPGISPKCNVQNKREFRRMVAAVEKVLEEGAWRDERQPQKEGSDPLV